MFLVGSTLRWHMNPQTANGKGYFGRIDLSPVHELLNVLVSVQMTMMMMVSSASEPMLHELFMSLFFPMARHSLYK